MIAMFLNLLDTQEEKDKFKLLYDEYKNLLYWIAIKKTNNIDDAEECVQETFFYVARHFEKIGDIKSKRTKGYLSAIVTGFAVDVYNNSLKFSLVPFGNDLTAVEEEKSFDEFSSFELFETFEKFVDEESRIFFYLKYIYGYKSREISEIYNVKDSYVRKKLQLTRQKLKKNLE